MNNEDLTDDYLKGRLTAEEALAFEMRVAEDAALKRRVAMRRLIIEGIHVGYANELKERLRAFDSRLDIKQRFPLNWKMAASVVFLLLAGALSYTLFLQPKPGDFDFDEPGLPVTLSHSKQLAFNNAMSRFKLGDFQNAGTAFAALLAQQAANDTLLYYSALCDFRTDKTAEALEKFEQIGPESEFYEKALYRLALIYWKNKKTREAKALLKEVMATTEDSNLKREGEKALRAIP
jgi:tetratricopeptide (TPR) repeat protein